MSLILFAVVLLFIAAAVAIPVFAQNERKIDDADATVLGAAILGLGLGGLSQPNTQQHTHHG